MQEAGKQPVNLTEMEFTTSGGSILAEFGQSGVNCTVTWSRPQWRAIATQLHKYNLKETPATAHLRVFRTRSPSQEQIRYKFMTGFVACLSNGA